MGLPIRSGYVLDRAKFRPGSAAIMAPDLPAGGDETVRRRTEVAALAVCRFGKLWACIAAGIASYWFARWLL